MLVILNYKYFFIFNFCNIENKPPAGVAPATCRLQISATKLSNCRNGYYATEAYNLNENLVYLKILPIRIIKSALGTQSRIVLGGTALGSASRS